MALSDAQVRSEIDRLVEQSLDDFTRRLDSLTAPEPQITEILGSMGLPDFAEAWGDYVEESGE